MIRRSIATRQESNDVSKAIETRVRRIWIIFGTGLILESLQVNVSKISYSGIEVAVGKSGAIVGIIYLVGLMYFLYTLLGIMQNGVTYGSTDKRTIRNMIFIMCSGKKSLKNRKTNEILLLKSVSRTMIATFNICLSIILFVPPFIMLFFKASFWLVALKGLVFGF